MKKIIRNTLFVCLANLLFFSQTALARDIVWEEEPELTDIRVTVQYEGSFSERLELYFNGIQKSALWYDESMENHGYTKIIQVEPGTYQFDVLSSTDLDQMYSYSYPEKIDTTKDTDISITVTQQEQSDEGLYSGHADGEHKQMIDEVSVEPRVYDFSEGKESGTIYIHAQNYGAVKSLQYTLVGETQTYEIILDRDHLFEAQVILPIGSYYESSELDIELSDAASVRDEVTFLWSHQNAPSFWGNYYNVTSDETIHIDDLMINMVSGSEITELNSDVLFADNNAKNLIEAQQQHNQEQLESAFPEIYGTSSEAETIPEAQEIEEEPFDMSDLPFVIGGLLCGFGIGFAIYQFRKKKRK